MNPPDDATLRAHVECIHTDLANFAWADGHIKALRYDQMRRWMFGCHKRVYPGYQ